MTSGTALNSVTLNVHFTAIVNGISVPNVGPILVNFTHTETPNDGADPRDIISISTSTTTVNIAGQNYSLDVLGFVDGLGNIVSTVLTNENAINQFQLAVRFDSADANGLTVNGNVLTNDSAGADGAAAVVGVAFNATSDTNPTGGFAVNGTYGTLVLQANGSYVYTLTADGANVPDGATETFVYTMRDGDGDTNTANLVITLDVVDSIPPTVTITDDQAGTGNIAGGDIVYTFQFSEPVTGFTAADITVANGTKGTFTAVDGDTYTLVVTPTAGFTGNVTVDVPAGGAFDLSSNANTVAVQSVQPVDMAGPSVTITDDEGAATGNIAGGSILYTFQFSEALTAGSFTAADITVTNGAKGTFTAVDADTYTLVVTPTAGFTGNVTVDVAAGVATDVNLNPNTAAVQSVQAVDMLGPSVTITDDEAGTGNIAGGDIVYTFQFSEALTAGSFTAADITVVNGTKGTFTAVDADTYTLVVTPTPGFTGNVTVNVAAGVATDVALNPNTAAAPSVQAVDMLAPTVTITDDEAGTANIAGGNIVYTFQFSQPVTGFTAAGITVVNGTKGTFTAVDADTYTLVVTPTPGFEGNLTVDVAAGVATDANGNGNTAAVQSVQVVDTLAPTAGLDTVLSNFAGNPYTIPEWAVLRNDTGATDVSGISSQTNLSSVTHTAGAGTNGTININDDGSGTGSFVYTVTDGANPGTGNANVTNQIAGNLTGTVLDEILIGDGAGNTFNGAGGVDIILAGLGNDTIVADAADYVIDGQGDTDTLQVGASFNDSSDAQIVNIENVTITAAGVTLNLGDQTEDFFITGSANADSITAGAGDDTIVGAVNDTLLDGGAGTDTLNIGASFTSTGEGQIANI